MSALLATTTALFDHKRAHTTLSQPTIHILYFQILLMGSSIVLKHPRESPFACIYIMTLVVKANFYCGCARVVQDCHDHQLQMVGQLTVGLPQYLDVSSYS